MLGVDRDFGPLVESERGGAFVRPEAEQGSGGDDVPPACAAPRDPFDLPQLFQRVDADVRVGADADPDPALAKLLDRREAAAQVRLGGWAEASPRSRFRDEIELVVVRVRRVDDGRSRPEAAGVREELDRAHAVLREALVDLARLLVRV